MNVSARRWIAYALFVPAFLAIPACGPQPSQAPQVIKVEEVSVEPTEIELSEPVVTLAPDNLVKFEVKYKFVKGKPNKYYMCEISFPDTDNVGKKPMEAWQMKTEGVIKDGIFLQNPPVSKFEIKVSETAAPINGFTKCSNIVSGTVAGTTPLPEKKTPSTRN